LIFDEPSFLMGQGYDIDNKQSAFSYQQSEGQPKMGSWLNAER